MASPKTQFVVEDLISKIYARNYSDGKLPSERTLAMQYNVSRFTVQKALRQLEDMGLLTMQQGGGVYIREKMLGNPLVYNSATQVSYQNLESRLIYLKKVPANQKQQSIFSLQEGEMVWEYKRLRIINYVKSQIETSVLPCSLFPALSSEVIEDSIQNFALEEGYRISHFMTQYISTALGREEAELLSCKKSTPAFLIKSRGFLQGGSVFVSSVVISVNYECAYIVPFNKDIFMRRRNKRKTIKK